MSTRRPFAALAVVATLALVCAGCGSGSGGDESNAAGAPPGTGGNTGSRSSSAHAKAVRFAECMRAHGVGGFPDPDASGSLTLDGVMNGSSIDPNGAAWKQAIAACKHVEPSGFTGTNATPQQMTARLQFAQCVRDHGVRDFPDPAKDGPLVDTNRIPSTEKAGGMSILNAAMRKCSSYSYKAGVRPGP